MQICANFSLMRRQTLMQLNLMEILLSLLGKIDPEISFPLLNKNRF